MCGLAGFSNVNDRRKRWQLVWSLGCEIDERGGHAAGFVTLDNGEVIEGRKLGLWMSAHDRFIKRAAIGHTTLMHARFATCGRRTIDESHPFKIGRSGSPVLWGAHNGMIWDAEESSWLNDREYSVDSKELFELLADNELSQIQGLNGYGVITWVEASAPGDVLLAKLSSSGEIYVCETKCGAIVWGSTSRIVHEALKYAKMKERHHFKLDEIGRVYRISGGKVTTTSRHGVRFAEWPTLAKGWSYVDDDREPWTDKDNEFWEAYIAAQDRDMT